MFTGAIRGALDRQEGGPGREIDQSITVAKAPSL